MLFRCCCRHFENLKSLRYGIISLLHGQCAHTIMLHNAVKFAAVKWTLLTVSFVKQMATLCCGKKFIVRRVKVLLPGYLNPIQKAMLLHRQMMGVDGQFQIAKLSTGSAMLNRQGCRPEQMFWPQVLLSNVVFPRVRASPHWTWCCIHGSMYLIYTAKTFCT